MKTVGQLMTDRVVTIRSTDTVASAVQHLRDHRIEALPVVDDGRLVGIVTLRDLIGHPSYRPISEVMTREVVTVPVSEPVTAAFAAMESRNIGRLPVLSGDRVVGIVTRSDLLRELGKLTDPLTELPWAGSLRQTAADLLKGGREIAIVFIDLDDFGRVNKVYGHVVGDRIIRAAAAALAARIDPALDFLCRYGGDEFAVVTTRDLAGAEALAGDLREAIAVLDVAGAPRGAVNGSFGIAGGKRATERADVHVDATVDDLITLASRASTMAKRTERHVVQGSRPELPAPPVPAVAEAAHRAAIRRVAFAVSGGRGMAAVELEYDGRVVQGRADGPVPGTAATWLMAEATLRAVQDLLPPTHQLLLEGVSRTPLGASEALNVVLLSVAPDHEEHLIGSAVFSADPQEAAVKATMKAVNLALARVLAVPV
jgi:diguanylate cyclase (GGDEF)-like protein